VQAAPAGDAFGHGTAVAALLVAHAPGIAIESLRMLDSERQGSSERVLAGLRWAIERKFDIVNCSFGTFGPATTKFLASYKRVIDLAFCENVLLIGACSNSDHKLTSLPASFPTVLATDAGRLAEHPVPLVKRRAGHLIEFVTRGVDVSVSWKDGSSRLVTGSSFAAPHLAALVARIRELRPKWNSCEMKAALYRLSEPVTAADDAD
jgi:subtilisin